MHERTRYRLTGGIFLIALALLLAPLLPDDDEPPGVTLIPIELDDAYEPPDIPAFDEVAPESDLQARVEEMRQSVDADGFHADTDTRFGEPVLSAPDDATEAWAVQLGAFRDAERARAFRDRLRQDGQEAFISTYRPAPDEVLFRVAVGPLVNKGRAQQLAEELSLAHTTEARLMAFGN